MWDHLTGAKAGDRISATLATLEITDTIPEPVPDDVIDAHHKVTREWIATVAYAVRCPGLLELGASPTAHRVAEQIQVASVDERHPGTEV